jgi:hypothetical protein
VLHPSRKLRLRRLRNHRKAKEFGTNLKNVPASYLRALKALAALKGIGVRTVDGTDVFHATDEKAWK